LDHSNGCWRLESNFIQLSAVLKAGIANEKDRFWDFNQAKSTAAIESVMPQMRYPRWTFEIESRERRAVAETQWRKKSDLPINTNSWGTAQIANHFATVRTD
jgi:hypothetical protein